MAPIWQTAAGKEFKPRYLGALINFHQNKLFEMSFPSMKNVNNGEKKRGREGSRNNETMLKIVATDVNHINSDGL